MAYELGRRPETLRVFLIRGEDLVAEIELLDEGASFAAVPPVLTFASGAFPAVLIEDGDVARFTLPAAVVNALAQLEDRTVALSHRGTVLAKGRFDVA